MSRLEQLTPREFRVALPVFLAGFIDDPASAAANLERVGALVAGWSDETCGELLRALLSLKAGDGVLDAHPAGRELARVWSRDVVREPVLRGVEHLAAAVADGPTVILGNHLSYFDTSATDAALAWAGHADLADRLVAAAGPKVYTDTFRRIAAVCLHTLPVPQSTSLSHTDKIPPRELARQAKASLDGAVAAAAGGRVLLLYPEGSRTRTGRLGPFLRGVHRYLSLGGASTRVVPCAITGTDRIMPVDASRLRPGPVTVTFGEPVLVDEEHGPKQVLPELFARVAALLPEGLQPLPSTAPVI